MRWLMVLVAVGTGVVVSATAGATTISVRHAATVSGGRSSAYSGISVLSAVFSANGKRIMTSTGGYVGDSNGVARIWDVASGRLLVVLRGNTDDLEAGFSPNGRFVVAAGTDSGSTARIWYAASGRLLHSLLVRRYEDGYPTGVPSFSAAFSPDGTSVLIAYEDGLRVWHTASGRLLTHLPDPGAVDSAVFSPEGNWIMTVNNSANRPNVIIWDAATGSRFRVLQHRWGIIWTAVFSPDGERIVTAGNDETARIWDATSGRLLRTLRHRDLVRSAAFSSDGKRVVTASADKTAGIWNVSSGRLLHTLRGHTGRLRSAAFSPDGKKIVTASLDGTARVWDASNGRFLHTLTHADPVESAAFSPSGKLVVTASDDGTAKVWDAVSGRLVHTLRHT